MDRNFSSSFDLSDREARNAQWPSESSANWPPNTETICFPFLPVNPFNFDFGVSTRIPACQESIRRQSIPFHVYRVSECLSQLFVTVTRMSHKNNLEEGKLIWSPPFQKFQFTVGWLHCSRLMVRQHIVRERPSGGKLPDSWQSQEGERVRRKGAVGKRYPSKARPRDPPPPALPLGLQLLLSPFKCKWTD